MRRTLLPTLVIIALAAPSYRLMGQIPPDTIVPLLGQAPEGTSATLEVIVNDVSRVFRFSPSELVAFAADPGRLRGQLEAAGAACCKPRKISACVWVCCDGKYYKTCDPRLQTLLSQIGF